MCKNCDHIFSKKFNLDRHIKTTHNGEKEFSCAKCSKNFGQKGHKDRHMELIHGGIHFSSFKCLFYKKYFLHSLSIGVPPKKFFLDQTKGFGRWTRIWPFVLKFEASVARYEALLTRFRNFVVFKSFDILLRFFNTCDIFTRNKRKIIDFIITVQFIMPFTVVFKLKPYFNGSLIYEQKEISKEFIVIVAAFKRTQMIIFSLKLSHILCTDASHWKQMPNSCNTLRMRLSK